jgi:hypothetical protein
LWIEGPGEFLVGERCSSCVICSFQVCV